MVYFQGKLLKFPCFLFYLQTENKVLNVAKSCFHVALLESEGHCCIVSIPEVPVGGLKSACYLCKGFETYKEEP